MLNSLVRFLAVTGQHECCFPWLMLISTFSTGSLISAPSSYLLCVVTKGKVLLGQSLRLLFGGQPVVGESGREE